MRGRVRIGAWVCASALGLGACVEAGRVATPREAAAFDAAYDLRMVPDQIPPKDAPYVEAAAVEELPIPQVDCTKVSEDGYRKGKRRAIEVITIDGRMIEQRTADAFWAMREAAAKDGIELTIFSAFRTHAEQQYFYGCYTTCACNSCAQAAKPGFSNHQSGTAIDIAMWPGVHAWLVAHGARFGFSATVKSEPWHWEYRPRKRTRWPSICAAK